jgi:hypothetical protein
VHPRGAATSLDTRKLSFQSLTISGTGSSLYYFATADSFSASHTLMRCRRSSGVLDTVLTGVHYYLASPVSDDIAYLPTNTDTLVLYTPDTRAKRTVGYRMPLTFSPDGLDLLTHNPGAVYSSFLVFHTADGTETGITLDRGFNSYRFAWYADGMIGLWIVLDEGGSHAYAYNFTTGFTDTVKYINAPYVTSGFAFSANSPRVGFWSTKGTSFTFVPLFGNVPTAWDYIVNVYSFATHTSTPYTVGNTGNASASGGMAFSPSGTRMACAYRGGVTLLSLQ